MSLNGTYISNIPMRIMSNVREIDHHQGKVVSTMYICIQSSILDIDCRGAGKDNRGQGTGLVEQEVRGNLLCMQNAERRVQSADWQHRQKGNEEEIKKKKKNQKARDMN